VVTVNNGKTPLITSYLLHQDSFGCLFYCDAFRQVMGLIRVGSIQRFKLNERDRREHGEEALGKLGLLPVYLEECQLGLFSR